MQILLRIILYIRKKVSEYCSKLNTLIFLRKKKESKKESRTLMNKFVFSSPKSGQLKKWTPGLKKLKFV